MLKKQCVDFNRDKYWSCRSAFRAFNSVNHRSLAVEYFILSGVHLH